MDNFDLRKYLTEGKLLKETKEEDYYNLLMDLKGTELDWVTERRFEDMMLKRGNYDSFEDFLDDELDFFQEEGNIEIINKIKSTFLNENKLLKEYLDLEIDEDEVIINSFSGEYTGFIEDDGTVDFSVVYEDEDDRDGEEFDEDNWKDILGPKHAFVKISNQIPTTKVEAVGDYVMITVDLEDLKAISDLDENKILKERYDKESLLKALGDADDAFIQLSNGRELVIYNPNSNNDENADMWNNDVVYAVSKDGDEVEVLYSDIAGINLEKENMQDADLLAKLAIDILDEINVYAEDEELIQYLNKSMDYLERIPSNDDVYSAIQAVADGLNPYTGEELAMK